MAAAFRDIEFGLADAEKEAKQAPHLLAKGFLNLDRIIEAAITGSRFLFLGYKGSGKSALSEKIIITAEGRSDLFGTKFLLADFPYTDFKRIVSGNGEPEAKYPVAWSWLLLLKVIESFNRDNALEGPSDLNFSDGYKHLVEMGLLPGRSLRELVLISSKQTFKVTVPAFLEAANERSFAGQDIHLSLLVNYLKRLVFGSRTPNKHIIVLDGLDDILTSRVIQFQSIAALIYEVSRLNNEFVQLGAKVKIIVVCRTDLYERLPGPNKNKIRQDSAVNLDWYHDPRQPGRSNLVELINLRTQLVDPHIADAISFYFPHTLDSPHKSCLKSLLDYTRHTPRDFGQLLRFVQEMTTRFKPTHPEIMSGLRKYSIDYFLPEIKDELVGYVEDDVSKALFNAVSANRKRDFTVEEMVEALKERLSRKQIEETLEAMFECSAIGNMKQVGSRDDGRSINHFVFKYRNRAASISYKDPLLLHKGIWKAMDVEEPIRRSQSAGRRSVSGRKPPKRRPS